MSILMFYIFLRQDSSTSQRDVGSIEFIKAFNFVVSNYQNKSVLQRRRTLCAIVFAIVYFLNSYNLSNCLGLIFLFYDYFLYEFKVSLSFGMIFLNYYSLIVKICWTKLEYFQSTDAAQLGLGDSLYDSGNGI